MSGRVATGPGWELREGRWQDVLADVEECDAVITDPPYSERTHSGQRHGRKDPGYSPDRCLTGRGLCYEHWTPEMVREFCAWSASAAHGWVAAFSSHDLAPAYAAHLESAGRYVFAPIACVQSGMNVRLAGDGPANWTCWLTVARPRTGDIVKWGALPGAYTGGQDRKRGEGISGGKPLWLMRAIIRDYTRPGAVVVDPCAGGGTTLLAAVIEGRRAIGAEIDPKTFDLAVARLRKGYTPDLFGGLEASAPAENLDLFAAKEAAPHE